MSTSWSPPWSGRKPALVNGLPRSPTTRGLRRSVDGWPTDQAKLADFADKGAIDDPGSTPGAWSRPLEVDGLAVHCHGCLAKRLGERGVRVNGEADIDCVRTHLDREPDFGD